MEIFLSSENEFLRNILFSILKDRNIDLLPIPEEFNDSGILLVDIESEKDIEKIDNLRKHNKRVLLFAIIPYKSESIKEKALNAGADEIIEMPLEPSKIEMFISIFSAAIESSEPYTRERSLGLHKIAEKMSNLIKENDSLVFMFLDKLNNIALIRDNETADHTQRVGKVSELLAEEIGMSPKAVIEMRITAPLHDIGKIAIPDSILFKKGPLNDEEWKIMKTHTKIGGRILESEFPILKRAQKIALYHHERYDGKGYPQGLKGEEIPIEARIVNVSDSFDAIVSKRSYKDARHVVEAVDELVKNSGSQFDPNIVKAFTNIVEKIAALYQSVGVN